MSAMFASMTCKVKPNYISYFFHHSYLGEFLSNDGTTNDFMMHNTMIYILLFIILRFTILSAVKSQESIASFILVPHGLSPDDAERVIIPAACVADDKSVIHIGRMFIRGGVRHKCDVKGDTVTYEQESTCYDNGIHYDIGEHFRNGSFVLICQKDGITIEGCYARNTDITIPIGTERILDHYLHKCELLDRGRVRYTANLIGCKKDNEFFNEGQIWTSEHIRYQCTSHGIVRVLGCVDDNGLFVELGRDILMHNIVHRCYRIDKTTVYHRFACVGRTLVECILTPPLQRPRPVSKT